MRDGGLLTSLDEFSLKASLVAICAPVLVLLAHLAVDPPEDDIPRWLFIVETTAFIMVPMLALAGASTALIVAGTRLSRGRTGAGRSVVLVCLAAWAVAAAVYFVLVVVPEITA